MMSLSLHHLQVLICCWSQTGTQAVSWSWSWCAQVRLLFDPSECRSCPSDSSEPENGGFCQFRLDLNTRQGVPASRPAECVWRQPKKMRKVHYISSKQESVFPVFLGDVFHVLISQKRGYLKGNSFKISMTCRWYQNYKYKNHTNGFPWQRVFAMMMMTVIMMMSPETMMMSCVTPQKNHCECVCALLRCNKRARLRYKKRGRLSPWDKTRKHTRTLESHNDGKRGTNRQSYWQTERDKARNVTGPRNVMGGERERIPDTSRHQAISMDDWL